MADSFVWDDRTWDQVWERMLDPVERHSIAVAVLRRRVPSTAFEQRIALELAKRWRRQALKLSAVYLLWTGFWGAIGWRSDVPPDVVNLPLGCVAVGLFATVACLVFRYRLLGLDVAPPGGEGF